MHHRIWRKFKKRDICFKTLLARNNPFFQFTSFQSITIEKQSVRWNSQGPAITSVQFNSPSSCHKPDTTPVRHARGETRRAVRARRKNISRVGYLSGRGPVLARSDRMRERACGRCGRLAKRTRARAYGRRHDLPFGGRRVFPLLSARVFKYE